MKKTRIVTATLVAAFSVSLLAGCSTSTITSGAVTSKEHHHSYIYPQRIGKLTVMHMVPESWEICFSGTNKNNKIENRCVDVQETIYNRTNIGDPFLLNE